MSARILVLSDSILAELIQAILKRKGYQISVATSEQDALLQLQERYFDLLILLEHLPSSDWGYNFLSRWRSSVGESNTLTLMITGQQGYDGIVRGQLHSDQAHAYIIGPFAPDDFAGVVYKLLAGASTQRRPGDEGYIRYENHDLAVAVDHPAFWRVGTAQTPEQTGTFQYSSVCITGPMNRYQSLYSAITVRVYLPRKPASLLVENEVLMYELRHLKNVHQTMPDREVRIAGQRSKEAEFVWRTDGNPMHRHSMWRRQEEQGKLIAAAMHKAEAMYVLSLMAAEDEFEDFRPVYTHLLETIQFLE
jgi:DNA-binding response OmpR family regulator